MKKTFTLTLEGEWKAYRDTNYPGGIPALQESEIRQAFFSGCFIASLAAKTAYKTMPCDQASRLLWDLAAEADAVCRERIVELKNRQ
jgi:hypothetical protein